MLRRVAKMAIKRSRYRLGLRAFAAAYDTATVSRERRHFYLMRYRYVACRRAIGIWIRRVKDPWKRVASRVAGVLDQPRLLAGAPATGGYADLVAVLSPLVHRLGTLLAASLVAHLPSGVASGRTRRARAIAAAACAWRSCIRSVLPPMAEARAFIAPLCSQPKLCAARAPACDARQGMAKDTKRGAAISVAAGGEQSARPSKEALRHACMADLHPLYEGG